MILVIKVLGVRGQGLFLGNKQVVNELGGGAQDISVSGVGTLGSTVWGQVYVSTPPATEFLRLKQDIGGVHWGSADLLGHPLIIEVVVGI